MEDQELEIKATIQVLKPISEVFDAIVDPGKMTNYFISESTGRMEEGRQLVWRFPEFDENVPVSVGKIIKDAYISYSWEVNGKDTLAEITLKPGKPGATIVTVTEKSMKNDEAGIKWLKGNTEGWANFLASLKAYLEYGVNLRNGAFDYR